VRFFEVLTQVIELLQREGRVSYRALKREFGLDDAYLDDLKAEIIQVKKLAVDEDGVVLVWTGNPASAALPVSTSAPAPNRAPLVYTPPYLTDKILAARAALTGERKQVTVLFADIKDSTELIRGLDPEAAQQLLDHAIHRMMDAVHRFEGTVNQVLGDGIMALFGAPIAHEDHGLRACYAALAMQAAMQRYTEEVRRTRGLELRMRVGLNAGDVVVRAIGNDLHMDYSAVGETTHLAARMEQLATPGSIRLTAATLRLVEGLVRVNALGPVPVKGLPEPVEVFELTGSGAIRRRLQAAAARGLTPFVGRQQELTVLSQALARAEAGHGQVVAVLGEAGVGKSRLVHECLQSTHTQGWRVLEAASVSYGKATPYFPVLDLLKRYAQVDDHDDARTIRAKVTGHVLTLDDALQETLPALLSLLEALPEDSPFLHLDPPQRRQRILEVLQWLLLRESQVQPLLLVFEDLHWIDTETQGLLDGLVERLPTAQLLLLVNYRPEYQHSWGSKTYYTQLRLDPLPPAGADELLQALLGDDVGATGWSPLQDLKRLLIERTEGNPFFLEESVRTLVETGMLGGEPGAYRLAQTMPTIQVPATVQAVLAARIDRLPPEEKRLLQTAAVIGHEVPLLLLQPIAELPEADLHRALAHLQAAEFLYETQLFPERDFTFKHALTHEVAYGSLLQERRRALHARIVASLEGLAADHLTEQVDRLAHHAVRGEVWDKALAYSRQAGARSAARSAYRESVACFEQALAALAQLPETRDTLEQAIDLRCDLHNVLMPLDEQVRIFDHLRAAEALAERLDDPQRLGRVASYLCIYFTTRGEHDRAIAAGQRALALATTSGAFDVQVTAQTYLGQAYHAMGDFQQALDFSRRVIALLTGELLYARLGRVAPPALSARGFVTWCLSELGDFAEGRAVEEEEVRLAEAIGQLYSIAAGLMVAGSLHLRQGSLHKAIPLLERGLALCQSANVPRFLPMTACSLGMAYALAGRAAEAGPLLELVLERIVSGSRVFLHANVLTVLSEALRLVGRVDEASALAGRLLDLSHTHIGRGYQAHACRLLGDVARHRDPPDIAHAEAYFRQALALAEVGFGMRPLQAHCHRGLGTLYAQTGRLGQARTALSTAIDLYHVLEMTFWLPQAEAVLAQVE
jgi:class 3 adenylate cyclase/tetratricopeptide (TPR) repeat protein